MTRNLTEEHLNLKRVKNLTKKSLGITISSLVSNRVHKQMEELHGKRESGKVKKIGSRRDKKKKVEDLEEPGKVSISSQTAVLSFQRKK